MRLVAEVGRPPRGTPKNYLVGWILALLRDADLYGYELIRSLREDHDLLCDTGSVYRALRQLESAEIVRSHWDAQGGGPDRRVYAITDGGRELLREWIATLRNHRDHLDRFFRVIGSP